MDVTPAASEALLHAKEVFTTDLTASNTTENNLQEGASLSHAPNRG